MIIQTRSAHRAPRRFVERSSSYAGSLSWAQAQVLQFSGALEDEVDYRTKELKAAADREHDRAELLRRALLCPDAKYRQGAMRLMATTEVTPKEALVGGDFFDVFPLAGNRMAVVLGDICGKGLVAAVQVPAVKFALQAYLAQCSSPGQALSRLNDFLIERIHLDRTQSADPIVLTVLVLDAVTGAGVAAGAGANPLMMLRESDEAELIGCSDLPLGVLPEQVYEDVPVALAPGECLLLATDGITEARRGLTMLFPEGVAQTAFQSRRAALAVQCRQGSCFCQEFVETIRTAVMDGARAFGGGTFRDDAALILIRFCPAELENAQGDDFEMGR